MNNKDNKKSAKHWIHKLFRCSGTSLSANQANKTYFAHRYQTNPASLGKAPYSALFSDLDKQAPHQESGKPNFQQLFEYELTLHEDSPDGAELGLTLGSNAIQPTVNGFDLMGDAALDNQYTVLNCYDETLDTKTFRLSRHDGRVFEYLPGQYVTLSVEVVGRKYKRSYSLASSPSHRCILEITVKRDANGGVVSNWLNDNLMIGDNIIVKGPYGKFSCAQNVPPKILFLAAGSGIAPVMSMLRWLTDTEVQVDVSVLLSFRNSYDIIYRDELQLIAAHHSNIKLFITLTKEPSDITQWPGLTGRINRNLIAALVPDLAERAVYLCGPDAFMVDCHYYLKSLKLPDGQLFCESFTVNSPASSGHESTVSQPVIIQPATQPSPLRPSRNKTGSYQIKFAKSAKTIFADGSRTLLELAETLGINLDHECRAGSCGECMVKCLDGSVDMAEQAEIDDLDRKKGWAYACCAYPVSDAVVDI